MQYQGDLYAKIGRKYLKLEMTSDDVDRLERENAEYESESREVNIRMDKYIKETVPKLVKAREIIINLLNLPYDYCDVLTDEMKHNITEAEEFVQTIFENEEN